MSGRIAFVALFTLCVSTVVHAQPSASLSDPTTIQKGKAVYTNWCTPCHGSNSAGRGRFGGSGFPGTDALAAKYKGRNPAVPAVLDQRADLTPAAIKLFVRQGVTVMPFFRKTEISDSDLDAMVAYLMSVRPGSR